MTYLLAAIAGVWMADGLCLLVAPRQVAGRLREVLAVSPTMIRWEGLNILLGLLLVAGAEGLRYQPLWLMCGVVMVLKGTLLTVGPDRWRHVVLDWFLRREDVDYRFFGLGLCALALLLLHALGWLGPE